MADGLGLMEPKQPDVGFLGHLLRFLIRSQPCRDETQERGVVLAEEPLHHYRIGHRGLIAGGSLRGVSVPGIRWVGVWFRHEANLVPAAP